MGINQAWIAQQRAVCNAATQGKWAWYGDILASECESKAVISIQFDGSNQIKINTGNRDKIFIAAARTALPAALDALEASMQREDEKDAEIARLTADKARLQKELSLPALDYVGELKRLEEYTGTLRSEYGAAIGRLDGKLKQNARLKGERDAAIDSIRDVCNHCGFHGNGTDMECREMGCQFIGWRGLCSDNTDAPTDAESEGDHAE